ADPLAFQPFVVSPFAVDGLATLFNPDAFGDLLAEALRLQGSDSGSEILGKLRLGQLVTVIVDLFCCAHGNTSPPALAGSWWGRWGGVTGRAGRQGCGGRWHSGRWWLPASAGGAGCLQGSRHRLLGSGGHRIQSPKRLFA